MGVYEDFSAGLNLQTSRLVASQTKQGAGMRQATQALNVTLDEKGVRTALGYTRLLDAYLSATIRGLHYYTKRGLTSGAVSNELMAIANGHVYTGNGTTWTSLAAVTDAPKTRFITFNGYCIFMNGVDPVKQYDGATVADVTFTDGATPTPGPSIIFPSDARPKFVVEHRERLFYMNDIKYPYRFFTPNASTHNVFGNNSDAVDVGIGDGDALVGAASLKSGLLVLFKTKSIYVVSGSQPTDSATDPFIITSYSTELGCIAPDTIVSIGAEVYFLSQRGYKKLSQTRLGDIVDADPLYPIKPLLDTIDPNRSTLASATFNAIERCIYLQLPVNSTDWITIVYNVVTQGIMQRTGFDISNQIYVHDTEQHLFSRFDTGASQFRVFKNGIGNTYDGTFFSSGWECQLLATEEMNTRKFFGKFLAYVKTFNGTQVRCGAHLVNVDGSVLTVYFDFGVSNAIDGWDIGLWDVSVWDSSIATVLRQNRIGRGVAISIFFSAAAGAAFSFDRIELEGIPKGTSRR